MPARPKGADVTPASAESLLADFLARREAGEELAIEELCRAHPEQAEALQRLHDDLPGTTLVAVGLARGARDERGAAGLPPHTKLRRVPPERYEIGAEIAKGGMGSILRARDPDLRRELAIKVMRPDKVAKHAASPELAESFRRRFLEEAQVTAQLSHPGVVPVHELALDEEERPFFAMALVDGRDLQEVLELARADGEQWTQTRVVDVLLKVCETLAYAHSRGVVHRDLKPANVRVGSFGEVYVMDWGLAKLASRKSRLGAAAEGAAAAALTVDRDELADGDPSSASLTLDGTVVGSPGYMSPEQARGEELDARSDVYSVGAMLYALLAGRAPYHSPGVARSPGGIVLATREGPPESLARIAPSAAPELVAICERAMVRAPEGRYPSTKEMAEDLRAYLENRVVRAYETGAWAEFRKWVRRNRGTAAALAGFVLAVLAGTGITAAVQAQAARREAHDRRQILGLADMQERSYLDREKEQLWPALPARVPALASWLDRARGLQARLPEHRAFLATLPFMQVTEQEKAWLADQVQQLIEQIEQLSQETEAVEGRAALASSLADRTVSGGEASAAWRAAIELISESKRYGGLRIEPQLGLLPLREDPRSGLWEFWHVLSGEKPELDPDTGRWRIEQATGVVLVLIPGGEYVVGASEGDEFVRRYQDQDRDLPAQTVLLEPYFLSKYELTQAQWERAGAASESRHLFPTNPVEMVSCERAGEILPRLDLELPTEAQWEAGARGGTRTRFYSGDDPESLSGHVVLKPDLAPLDNREDRGGAGEILPRFGQEWQRRPEPVGGREPNPFGLHDVVGNVSEWCRDEVTLDPSVAMRDGDGLREPGTGTVLRILRGGNFDSSWPAARHSHRYPWAKGNREPDTGLRPVRARR